MSRAFLWVLLSCCAAPAPRDDRFTAFSPSAHALPPPPADVTNRFADDLAAAAFGEKLFFEAGFSGPLLEGDHDGTPGSLGQKGETGKVACSSCHVPEAAFGDNRSFQKQISLGSGWTLRHTQSLLDVGQAKLLMWDGSKDSLHAQIFGPIENVVEMNSSRLYVAERAFELYRAEYESIFGAMPPLDDAQRFPPLSAEDTGCKPSVIDPLVGCDGPFHGMPGDGAEYDSMAPEDQEAVTGVVVNLGKAIAAYERTLTCGTGRFDAWVHGDDDALSEQEQRGAELFIGRAGCATCHSGPFFTDQQFHNVGLLPKEVQVTFLDANDPGAYRGLALALADPLNSKSAWSDGDDDRLPQSVEAHHLGAFRTPSLRCTSAHPSFMHTGQIMTLESVVDFFNRGGDQFGYPGTKVIAPLGLDAAERAALVAFLRAL